MRVRLAQTTRCRSIEEFLDYSCHSSIRDREILSFEAALSRYRSEPFTIPGVCAICEANVEFYVDYRYASIGQAGAVVPNWRERLICPTCGLNNRQRAAVSYLLAMSNDQSEIYITEAVTSVAKAITSKRANVVGSEYLRDGTTPGTRNQDGIRHEDCTSLTFEDGSFDLIGSFEVLEHVPDYRAALREFFRCLKPGGRLIFTLPFSLQAKKTIVRAIVKSDGEIEHLLPPEIHGDPIDDGGALCFYHFGWDLIDTLKEFGFVDSALHFFWSSRLGHLDRHQPVVIGKKPAAW